jgi:hypothetical protein
MRQILLICALFLCPALAKSQVFNLNWAKSIGDTLIDWGHSVATDGQNNVYVMGIFKGTPDFDPGPNTTYLTCGGMTSLFISKFNANGDFLWAKKIDGDPHSDGLQMQVDNAGNIYLVGSITNTTDMDPGPGVYNLVSVSHDGFLCKLDANGNFLWAKNFGGSFSDVVNAVQIDGNGNIILVGDFYDIGDFDPGNATLYLGSINAYSISVVKLDAQGNLSWAKAVTAGGMFIKNTDVDVDNAGNIYFTGNFSGQTDFDPNSGVQNLTANGTSNDIFIAKWDMNGNYVWAKRAGANYNDMGYAIRVDNNGSVYYAGTFAGVVDFDPGTGTVNLTSGSNSKAFISKLDANGNFVWARDYGASGSSCIHWELQLDNNENIYTTGFFYGTSDFDPSSSSLVLTAPTTNTDSYILKTDSTGATQWVKHLTGTGDAVGSSIHITGSNELLITGYFSETLDCDPSAATFNLTASGSQDIYFAKYSMTSPTGIDAEIEYDAFTLYPNPVQETLHWNSSTPLTTIKLYTLDGRLLLENKKIVANSINLTGLPVGCYLFLGEGEHKTFRKIIEIGN